MIRIKMAVIGLLCLFSNTLMAQHFGGETDVDYARDLWQAMIASDYVGSDARMSRPYPGQHPHGAILDTIEGRINIRGERLGIVVKRNYSGQGISLAGVSSDPAKYLKGITVMLKRPGYDPENLWPRTDG